MPLTVALVALALAAIGGATARTPSSPAPPTVACEKIILTVGSGRAGGYRVVLGVVSVPPASSTQGGVPTHERPWTWWRKAGLVIRGDSPPVTVSVPTAWRNRVAITWGNTDVVSSLRIASCPAYTKPWNAYAGGFLLRSRSACVPLTFRVGRRSATVRFGIGRTCG
jgi:hypothetical protein